MTDCLTTYTIYTESKTDKLSFLQVEIYNAGNERICPFRYDLPLYPRADFSPSRSGIYSEIFQSFILEAKNHKVIAIPI